MSSGSGIIQVTNKGLKVCLLSRGHVKQQTDWTLHSMYVIVLWCYSYQQLH